MKLEDLTPEEKELLNKKFAQFHRLPKETNNICPLCAFLDIFRKSAAIMLPQLKA